MTMPEQYLDERLRATEDRLTQIEQALGLAAGAGVQLYNNPQASAPVDQFTSSGPEVDPEVMQLLSNGKIIAAVKRVRDLTGWDLKSAKQYVDDLRRQFGLVDRD